MEQSAHTPTAQKTPRGSPVREERRRNRLARPCVHRLAVNGDGHGFPRRKRAEVRVHRDAKRGIRHGGAPSRCTVRGGLRGGLWHPP